MLQYTNHHGYFQQQNKQKLNHAIVVFQPMDNRYFHQGVAYTFFPHLCTFIKEERKSNIYILILIQSIEIIKTKVCREVYDFLAEVLLSTIHIYYCTVALSLLSPISILVYTRSVFSTSTYLRCRKIKRAEELTDIIFPSGY